MITVRTSPAYVNRVRQDWTANGGVYGDGGVYALVPSNDPFAQLGPTLDLVFAGVPNNLGENGPSIDLYLYPQQYQIAAQYAEWDSYAINYSLLSNAILSAAVNIEPEKTLFKDALIGGRALGDINNSGTVTSADSIAYDRFISAPWLNASTSNDYIRDVLNPYMIANPGAYAAYLTPGPGLVEKTFSDIVTFTRASTATYFNSAGTLTSAAVDQPRFDYNPSTLAPLGFLIEESRTNSIRNNTMVGAAAGTPGTLPTNWAVVGAGLAFNVIGTGTENGISYIDIQLVGTTSGTSAGIRFETNTGIAAVAGQAWSNSVFARMVAGSTTNISSVGLNTTYLDGGAVIINSTTVSFQTTISQPSLSAALRLNQNVVAGVGALYVRPQIVIAYSSGVAIDITLRIGLPQLELGAFATSVIPTTTTALTRSADVASVNTLSPWFNAAEGTVYADYVTNAGSTSPIIWQIDNSSTNTLRLRYLSNQNQAFSIVSNVTVAQIYDQTGASQTTARTAFAYRDSDFAVRTNGGASASAAANTNSGAVPSGLNTLRFGASSTGTLNINGYFRRIVYYPRRLANADLQAITT